MVGSGFGSVRVEIVTLDSLSWPKMLSLTSVNILSKRPQNQDLMVPIAPYGNF